MSARVDIVDLSAYYGDHLAVSGVNLVVEPKQVTALIGPSGCGKSTVLRCINAMHLTIPKARATGQILLDGVDIVGEQELPRDRSRVGPAEAGPQPEAPTPPEHSGSGSAGQPPSGLSWNRD